MVTVSLVCGFLWLVGVLWCVGKLCQIIRCFYAISWMDGSVVDEVDDEVDGGCDVFRTGARSRGCG